MEPVSLLFGFLLGTATGAAGYYFGQKYTDQRREKEAIKTEQRLFDDLCKRFPQVLNQLKHDVKLTDHQATRRIVVLPDILSATLPVNIQGSYFKYSAEVFDDLIPAIHRLEDLGYLIRTNEKHVAIYRMTEEFVDLLRNEAPHEIKH